MNQILFLGFSVSSSALLQCHLPSLLCLYLPLFSQFLHTNSLTKLLLSLNLSPLPYFPDLVEYCSFKFNPPEKLEAKHLISCIPWTKAELQAIIKDFEK